MDCEDRQSTLGVLNVGAKLEEEGRGEGGGGGGGGGGGVTLHQSLT